MNNRTSGTVLSATPTAIEDLNRIWEEVYRVRGEYIANRVLIAIHEHFESVHLHFRRPAVRVPHEQYADIWSSQVLDAMRVTLYHRRIKPQQPASTKWTPHTEAGRIWPEPPRKPKIPERRVLLRAILAPEPGVGMPCNFEAAVLDSCGPSDVEIDPHALMSELHKKHGIESICATPGPFPSQLEAYVSILIGLAVFCGCVWVANLSKERSFENVRKAAEVDAERRKRLPAVLDSPMPSDLPLDPRAAGR